MERVSNGFGQNLAQGMINPCQFELLPLPPLPEHVPFREGGAKPWALREENKKFVAQSNANQVQVENNELESSFEEVQERRWDNLSTIEECLAIKAYVEEQSALLAKEIESTRIFMLALEKKFGKDH